MREGKLGGVFMSVWVPVEPGVQFDIPDMVSSPYRAYILCEKCSHKNGIVCTRWVGADRFMSAVDEGVGMSSDRPTTKGYLMVIIGFSIC